MAEITILYDTLQDVTKKVVEFFNENLPEKYRSRKEEKINSYVINEQGNWSIGECLEKSSGIPHNQYNNYILSLDYSERLFEILLDKGFIKKPSFIDSENNPVENPTKEQNIWSGCLHGGVFTFIGNYLKKLPGLKFDEEIFKQCYCEYERYHVSPEIRYISTIPLLNFKSDSDIIELDDDTKIVRLNHRELAQWGHYLSMTLSHYEPNDRDLEAVKNIFSSGFAIKVSFSLNKDKASSDRISEEKAQHIIMSLLLVKSGNPFYDAIFTEHQGFHPSIAGPSFRHPDSLHYTLRQNSMHLSTDDITSFKDIWDKLNRLSLKEYQGKLDVGIRKLIDNSGRKTLEDKIIDLSILLESTLLFNIRDELRYRLSLRGAHLLRSTRNAKSSFKLLQKFYDIRSDIVHNGKRLSAPIHYDGRDVNPSDFVSDIEDYCREVMRNYIDKILTGISIDRVNTKLDENALCNN